MVFQRVTRRKKPFSRKRVFVKFLCPASLVPGQRLLRRFHVPNPVISTFARAALSPRPQSPEVRTIARVPFFRKHFYENLLAS
jgi:hypothetical protein